MIYLPYAADLLEEAAHVLRTSILPGCQGTQRYELLMALRAIRIAQREHMSLHESQGRTVARLALLLNLKVLDEQSPGPRNPVLLGLGARLRQEIRSGRYDSGPDRERLLEILRDHTRQALSISDPEAVRG